MAEENPAAQRQTSVTAYLKSKHLLSHPGVSSGISQLCLIIDFLGQYTLFARFFAHKQDSQLNSSVLITVSRVVIENSVTGLPTN